MILDRMENIRVYTGVLPCAEECAKLFAAGSAEGASFEVRHKQYRTKDDSARKFEVHDRTIDLMACFSGSEVIHLCPESELLPGDPLPNGADGRKLVGAPRGSAILLKPGWFCAIYPGEAHMVGGHPGEPMEIDKWVMKIPCA